MAEENAKKISGVAEFVVKRPPQGHALCLLRKTLGMVISWQRQYANTLSDAVLDISYWNGHPPWPGIMHFGEPRKIRSVKYDFDITPSNELVWTPRSTTTKQLLSNELLVDAVLKSFLEEDYKRQSAKR